MPLILALQRGAVFADVTSANVVGYTTKNSDKSALSMSCPFVSISNGAKWKLGQVIPKGMNGGYDTIQFLDNNTARTYLQATWYDPADVGEEWGGWCNADDEDEMLEDLELTAGTTFLTNISDSEIDWTSSGAVIEAGSDGKITIDVSGQGAPFIANPLPKTIKMGQITPDGINGGYDTIQFLTEDTARTYLQLTWYSYEDYGEFGGWCNADDEDELLDDMDLPAGQGFLGNINTEDAPVVKFIFPAAL